MKFIWVAFILVIVTFPFRASAETFFVSLDDVPLMEGFTELEDDVMSFDNPAGRIIEVQAVSDYINASSTMSFYQKVLPQFGWASVGKNIYEREGEKLLLKVENGNEYIVLTISVMPQ